MSWGRSTLLALALYIPTLGALKLFEALVEPSFGVYYAGFLLCVAVVVLTVAQVDDRERRKRGGQR